jgi:hypothetical protein
LEARLSEFLGEQAYIRTGLGAPRNHDALEEQDHTLQNEIQELRAKLQDHEEELAAAREVNRQLIGQLNKTAASDGFDGGRGTIQYAACQDWRASARGRRGETSPMWSLAPVTTPGFDRSVDIGLDAGGDPGGRVKQPLQPDSVQHGGDRANFYLDLEPGPP